MRRALLAAAAVAVLAGCGGARQAHAREPEPQRAAHVLGARTARCTPGERPFGDARIAYAAKVPRAAVAYRAPGGARLARFGPRNANGAATVLGVRAAIVDRTCRPRWLRVQLPLRPNGIEGWVRAADVRLGWVATRIVVDLSARTVTLLRGGRRALRARAAVGSAATPTPTGRFYVDQRLISPDADGPFGPGAIGISAFSPVLTGWTQGGPIAIHGTNRPDLIGQAVSNGCIRVENSALRRLFAAAEPGTPVEIRR